MDSKDIYEQVKTPSKYGLVLLPEGGKTVDSPSVFRHGERWYMLYVQFEGAGGLNGYETCLAASDDLLHWQTLGPVLAPAGGGWDACQAAGYAALQDTTFGGSGQLQAHEGKYWLSYLGGALPGNETDPLAIGLAWTLDPSKPQAWQRIVENPVLHREQNGVRTFEAQTLYKSNIIADPRQTTGAPFVMFYNGKQKGQWVERIGMAVSDDLHHWRRFGDGPAVDNGTGITGDPQVVRIGEWWVMFYFGAFYRPGAFDTFCASRDLVHWEPWSGPDLVAPSEPYDRQFAHKPWVIKNGGVVYHYYCAVGDQGRAIALATSQDLGRSSL